MINNVLYVIVLSAALDLVGPNVPKGVVLLADVIPSFGTKLIAPYFIHMVPYSTRIVIFVFLSGIGMLLEPLGLAAGPVVPTREWRELYAALDCAAVAAIHPFYKAACREFEAAGRAIVGSDRYREMRRAS